MKSQIQKGKKYVSLCLVLCFGLFCIYFTAPPAVAVTQAPYINVTDYGAIPNDGLDDVASINTALANTRSGEALVFPDGVYNIGSTITLNQQVRLMGFSARIGEYGARLKSTSNVTILKLTSPAANKTEITNMVFDGSGVGANTTAPVVEVYGKNIAMRNVEIKSRGAVALKLGGTEIGDGGCCGLFSYLKVSNNGTGIGIHLTNGGGANATYIATQVDSCTTAIKFDSGGGSRWYGMNIESVTNGFEFNGVSSVSMSGVHSELVSGSMVSFNAAATGNRIDFNTYEGTISDLGVNNSWTGYTNPGGSNPTGHPMFISGKEPTLYLNSTSGAARLRMKGEGVESYVSSHSGGWDWSTPAGKVHTFGVGGVDILKINSSQTYVLQGILRLQSQSAPTCDASTKGGIHFNTDNHFYGCTGTSWVRLD